MKKRNLLLVILAVLLVFGMVMSCGPADETEGGGTTGGSTKVTFNGVTADGSATKFTTKLTLTFSAAITDLSADDIALSGVTGVTKGTLTNSGATYTLPISGFTDSGSLTVAVSKTGYSITTPSKSVTITGFDVYFQDYYANYGKKADNSPITEKISIKVGQVKFEDNETSTTDPDNLVFTATKWEDGGTVPAKVAETFPLGGANTQTQKAYTIAVKVSGTIASSKPTGSATTSPYGTKTCPGITQTDVTSSTPLYFYLYFTEEDDAEDILFVRSSMYKTPTQTTGTIYNPIDVREYSVQ